MKISREELSEIRKRELARKEFENEIGRDLKLKSEKMDVREQFLEDKNPWVLRAVIFFGTLACCYIAYFIVSIAMAFTGVAFLLGGMYIYFKLLLHLSIWTLAAVSAVTGRSYLDKIINRYM